MKSPTKPLPFAEFVMLLAMMTSIVALATDVMLPALDTIGDDLGVAHPNDAQLVISSIFIGFAVGQLFVGPLSDRYGRKPVIYLGYAVFFFGCLISMFATDFTVMLIGRVLQGLGIAGPRVVAIAIVRDRHGGRTMARIMSFVMAVFIIVPAIAPAIGQVVISFADWRATFALLLALGIVSCIWFALRQPETLPVSERRALSLRNMGSGIAEACSHRAVVGYTVAAGLIFGAFLGYLSSAQQIFQTSFETGPLFVLYFGVAALAIGGGSVFNSYAVMRLGMRLLTWWALVVATVLSLGFLLPVILMGGIPPFWLFMSWLLVTFFCMGIIFGNLNALAMEPLGHMAGLGAALVGSLSTLISLPLGWAVGYGFDGGVVPLVSGFGVLGLVSLGPVLWADRSPARLNDEVQKP